MADNDLPENPENRKPVVFEKDGEVFASSRDVAAVFEKNHRDVLRAIDDLISAAPEVRRNFAQGSYQLQSTGTQQHRCFEIDRDGFTLLAMGFTGAKALQWKLRYIEAFNAMEKQLKEAKPVVSQFDMMRAVIDNLESNNQRLFTVERAVENFGAHEDYRSIKAHAALNSIKITTKQSGELGRLASALSRQQGQKIGRQPDDAFGQVNTYHREILEEVFKSLEQLKQIN